MARSSARSLVENCWTLIGRRRGRIWCARRIRRSAGTSTTVAFDAKAVLDREEDRGDVVGFFHTHLHSDPQPSRRDVDTMRAWCSAFGKPLLCVIAGRTETAAFRFDDSNSTGVRLTKVEMFPRGVVLAAETPNAGESLRDLLTVSERPDYVKAD